MTATMILEILFHDEVQPDDLEIVRLPTKHHPGEALLNRARLGPVDPAAPNARPVLSWSGAKIGFLASAELFDEPPFDDTYQIPKLPKETADGGPATAENPNGGLLSAVSRHGGI